MSDLPENLAGVDWSGTTFEGVRREQLRRWAAESLTRVIESLEEMEELAGAWSPPLPKAPPSGGRTQETQDTGHRP